MSLIAGTLYDPAGAASKATSALLAMTALDTTNLRVTFKAPANGSVLVRLQGCVAGATTYPAILLGVLDGATVKGRVRPLGGTLTSNVATDYMPVEASFVVSGLTPGTSYTWDAAYGVETLVAATNIKYGGPNDASGNDAWGGFAFEVYDTIPLLASTLYDPSSAGTRAGNSPLAMTALDTSNLRLTFTVPPSGRVYWRFRVPWSRPTTVWGQVLLGILEGATVRARVAPQRAMPQVNSATAIAPAEGAGVVSGLTAGASLTWDAAYAVQIANANTILRWGGPDNATANDAWGGVTFEVWRA